MSFFELDEEIGGGHVRKTSNASLEEGLTELAGGRLFDINENSTTFTEKEEEEEEEAVVVEIKLDNYTSSTSSQPLSRSRLSPEDFHIVKVIGAGAYGKVFLVRQASSKRYYAMKTLKKASLVLHSKAARNTRAEREILEAVKHPFIVPLHYAFQTKRKLYLVLEYIAGGELFMHISRERLFSEDMARFIAAELVLALEHLHGLGIIYRYSRLLRFSLPSIKDEGGESRDLKPENVLLDHSGISIQPSVIKYQE